MEEFNTNYECPYCGNDDFELYESYIDGDYVVTECICERCKKEVRHYYELVYVETTAE